jgi:hypothetical protein
MFFFRDLILNLSQDSQYWDDKFQRYEVDQDGLELTPNKNIEWLAQRSMQELALVNPESTNDCIGIYFPRTKYLYAPVADPYQYGYELVYRFWVWGDIDDEILSNFGNTVRAITDSLTKIAVEIPHNLSQPMSA